MDDTTNWKPDPFGTHELRFFSADGRPTLLVMDGGKKSYDKPPGESGERPSTTDQSNPDPSTPEPLANPAPDPPAAPSVDPAPDHAPHSPPDGMGETQGPIPADESSSDGKDEHADLEDPIPASAPPSAESLRNPAVDRPQPEIGYDQPEAMSRPLKIAYAIVLGVLAFSVLGLVYVHLLHHSGDGQSTRAAAPTTTSVHVTTTSVHVTTTTAALPTTLSPSAEAAATALVSSWSTNNRSAALTVATPTAVGTLFSAPYASGLAIARGCSTAFSPIVCTFGPPGGASPNDPIYQILVSQTKGGWYVSSVKIEN